MQQEALSHALQSQSTMNYASIFVGFGEKGIAESDIKPRENVFTFHAWKALGRSVRKGEHGVKVCTWIPMTKKDDTGEAHDIGRKPRMTTVFHISQTDPISDAPAAKLQPVRDWQPQPRSDITASDTYEAMQ
jgi:antirestriction protein ArdC